MSGSQRTNPEDAPFMRPCLSPRSLCPKISQQVSSPLVTRPRLCILILGSSWDPGTSPQLLYPLLSPGGDGIQIWTVWPWASPNSLKWDWGPLPHMCLQEVWDLRKGKDIAYRWYPRNTYRTQISLSISCQLQLTGMILCSDCSIAGKVELSWKRDKWRILPGKLWLLLKVWHLYFLPVRKKKNNYIPVVSFHFYPSLSHGGSQAALGPSREQVVLRTLMWPSGKAMGFS